MPEIVREVRRVWCITNVFADKKGVKFWHDTSIQQSFQIIPSDICENLLQRPNCKIWFSKLQVIKNGRGGTKGNVPLQTFYNFWCNV